MFRQYAHKIGSHINGTNIRKGLGYASKLVSATRFLQERGYGGIKKIADKVPVDDLDKILGLARGVHHIATNGEGGGIWADRNGVQPERIEGIHPPRYSRLG